MAEPRGQFPRPFALAWELDEAPRRGPKPALLLADITRAAIELADEQGVAAVTMAAVASRLGFTTMSLYRYVSSKDDLIQLMVDAAFDPPHIPDPLPNWREGLEAYARSALAQYARHPWLSDVPISGPPALPRSVEWMDLALRFLEQLPLGPAERLWALLLISGYVRSEASLASQLERGRRAAGRSEQEVGSDYGALLEQVVVAEHLPALRNLLATGVFRGASGPAPGSAHDSFSFGLERILDGIERLVDARG